MGVDNYKELVEHAGHKIVVVDYKGHNAAVECETCGCVLLDFDNEEKVKPLVGVKPLRPAAKPSSPREFKNGEHVKFRSGEGTCIILSARWMNYSDEYGWLYRVQRCVPSRTITKTNRK